MQSSTSSGTEKSPRQQPVTDVRALRTCLGQYGTGVAVICAQLGADRCGMTVNSFSALSLSPPLVMWSIRNESSARQFFATAPYFSINVLAADQIDISARFAKSGQDPFSQLDWAPGEFGEPLLGGTVARLSCSLVQTMAGGDHTIIVGEVQSFERHDRTPLLFVQGEYRVSSPHPRQHPLNAASPSSEDAAGPSLMRQFHLLAARWIDEFDVERAEENLSRSQSRVLAWLHERPHTLDELRLHFGLDDANLEEDVQSLKAQGLLRHSDPLTLDLSPAGHDKRNSMKARIRQFEDAKLAGFEPAEVLLLKRFLKRLAESENLFG